MIKEKGKKTAGNKRDKGLAISIERKTIERKVEGGRQGGKSIAIKS